MDSDFYITIIGANSATAAFGRFPTSQYVFYKNYHFLIDCGEGTQFRMQDFKVPKSQISKIFISHLHGDHYYGLIGLLTSYSLHGRTKPLEIYCPKGLQQIIEIQNKYSDAYFCYEIQFIETNPETQEIIFEDSEIRISTFPLKHRIATTGFLFEEKKNELKIIKEKLASHNLSVAEIIQLKNRTDVTRNDGTILKYNDFTYPDNELRKYAYCSDTLFDETIVKYIEQATLLYHESTFDHSLKHIAIKTMHSTAKEAATIAHKAKVKSLLLGHFSSRYSNTSIILEESKQIFEASTCAIEGNTYPV